jgi:hypothetical protein
MCTRTRREKRQTPREEDPAAAETAETTAETTAEAAVAGDVTN